MRTLFTKILAWFLATIAITSVAMVVTTAFTVAEPQNRQSPFAQMLRVESHEARHAWETGGRNALAAAVSRFNEDGHHVGYFTDASGRDLVTGEDRSEWLRTANQQLGHSIIGRERSVLARPSEDGKYWFIMVVTRRPFFFLFWFLHVHYLWILGIVVLLSYLFARTLTSPLRGLQKAVQAFGHGNLAARVHSRRKDELGEVARTFDGMADRIQTLMTAERRLLADISHELRSPLARLSVAVELARTGDDREAALSRIEKEADRLNTLVGELLQVTRAEMDPANRRREPLRVDQLLAQTVDDCNIEAEARGCSVQFDGRQEVTIPGDPELLRRAIENVIRNAVRYAPSGTAVEVTLDSNPARVLIGVRDRGPGVPEEALARIFDAFYRVEADRGRSSGGVGLGLAIARRAVELHSGSLRARNMDPGLLVEIELLR